MLVLSRQKDESIVIGDDIEITVVDIRGDKVRLGVDAPSEIPVHRKEVYEAIQRENVQAAQVRPGDVADVDSIIGGSSGGRVGRGSRKRECWCDSVQKLVYGSNSEYIIC